MTQPCAIGLNAPWFLYLATLCLLQIGPMFLYLTTLCLSQADSVSLNLTTLCLLKVDPVFLYLTTLYLLWVGPVFVYLTILCLLRICLSRTDDTNLFLKLALCSLLLFGIDAGRRGDCPKKAT
jgi:hypothetical protein